jgi:hypothetical protein
VRKCGPRLDSDILVAIKIGVSRMQTLYEIKTTHIGESYCRSYIWCDSLTENPVLIFREKEPLIPITSVTILLTTSTPTFASELSDSGFDFSK